SPAKNRPPEPLPSGLRVLSAIATLQAGADESTSDRFRAAIASAGQECSSPLMGAGFCEAILRVGRHWLGWVDFRRGRIGGAVQNLAGAERSGWTAWAAGRKAFRDGNYREAAARYRDAVQTWETSKGIVSRTLLEQLGPPPDLRAAYGDLGDAQLLAGEWSAA